MIARASRAPLGREQGGLGRRRRRRRRGRRRGRGWLHARAAENQYQEFMDMENGDQQVIGVSCFQDDESPFEVDGFMGTDDAFDVAIARLNDVLRTRHEKAASSALKQLEADCRSDTNIMPAMMEAMSAEVTLGEIGNVYREVFGNWNTPIQT